MTTPDPTQPETSGDKTSPRVVVMQMESTVQNEELTGQQFVIDRDVQAVLEFMQQEAKQALLPSTRSMEAVESARKSVLELREFLSGLRGLTPDELAATVPTRSTFRPATWSGRTSR